MTNKPTSAPSLADLRQEIDRIDEAMHQLLMERGQIIDRLIATKKTQESGSAFRPAREADMMRRLVQRHHGILPLDTAESIWRVIIATFTHVQAPFSVHADLSAGDAMMRDSARFHFGFTVPFVPHVGAASAVEAVSESKGDLALVPATDNRSAISGGVSSMARARSPLPSASMIGCRSAGSTPLRCNCSTGIDDAYRPTMLRAASFAAAEFRPTAKTIQAPRMSACCSSASTMACTRGGSS
jgi:chorismate mutase